MKRALPALTMPLLLFMLASCNERATISEAMLTTLVRNDSEIDASTTTSSNDEWSKAIEPREFRFPRDHGAHEDYRIEWWYYTGNLKTEDGRHFGYQLTFFRTGLRNKPNNPSRWAVRDLYTAHFAISDIQSRRHFVFQRNSRKGIGLAGAELERYEVWNGDWKVSLDGDKHQLFARESGCSIDLTLRPSKPLVLHGDRGLSRKGVVEGNASYYYSFTRLATEGTVTLDGEQFVVTGNSWMDHEFSTSFLEKDQLGWDWFAIQLENDFELMLYQMRRADGTVDAYSSGTIIDPTGSATHLSKTNFTIQPLKTWRSPDTDAEYPTTWKIELPEHGYVFELRARFNEQEMTTEASTGISYWEGSVSVAATMGGTNVRGLGYAELTGYTGKSLGSLFER